MTADFDGGLISSDGGLVLLRGAECRLGLAERLAGCIRDWRDPTLVVHTLPAMLRFRMFAIACGYEDADDCDALRTDPLFKLAVGRAPESGRALCSQPTMSRLENAPSRLEVARMTAALVDIFCRSFAVPPAAINAPRPAHAAVGPRQAMPKRGPTAPGSPRRSGSAWKRHGPTRMSTKVVENLVDETPCRASRSTKSMRFSILPKKWADSASH